MRPMNDRTGISLNGTWTFRPYGGPVASIEVPDFWDAHPQFAGVDRAVYERDVVIPDDEQWRAKVIRVEFEGVNFLAEVSVDGRPLARHIGGWIPFAVDVTPSAAPGKTFRLSVEVCGADRPPFIDAAGNPLWPVGFFGHRARWGIVFEAWLRAYGEVNVRDVMIRTSFRERRLTATYEIENNTKETRSIRLIARTAPALRPHETCLEMASEPISIAPGATITTELFGAWPSPRLWSPDDPHLSILSTDIVDACTGETVDRRRDRFGFREIWIEGNRLLLNGRRLTILGANIVQHSEFHDNQRFHFMTRETWHRTIDRLFDLNLRAVRFHMQPAPPFVLDAADERGLLIIDESPIYARDYMLNVDIPTYLDNCRKWIGPWVRARRNHPSIMLWNATNEMTYPEFSRMTALDLKTLGDEIRKHDPTRPVNYDGDGDVGDALVNLHYPETYMASPSGSIYSWAGAVRRDKPTGVGECFTHYGPHGRANQWWQGTWVRGMRYAGFCDIRPYRHDWAILRGDDTACIENLKNSLSPVALFDKEYDDMGIDPLVNGNYPRLIPGETVRRTLVLYNGDFTDEDVEIEVLVISSEVYQALYHYAGDRAPFQKIVARGSRCYSVEPGEHVDIPYSFQVPASRESIADSFDVKLIARKKGRVRFQETKRFSVWKNDFKGPLSPVVALGDAKKI